MTEPVRVGLLMRTCLEVLAEADEPIPTSEALKRVEQRIDLTSYESGPVNSSGQPRWENNLRWRSGDMTTIGWMSKRDGLWTLTDAGEAALEAYDAERVLTETNRRKKEIHRQRQQATEALGGLHRLIAEIVALVEPSAWTSFDDIAEIANVEGQRVGHFLASGQTNIPMTYRVLNPDGSIPEDSFLPSRHRGMDVAKKLRTEGVEFDPSGCASQDQRLTAEDIRDRLSELDDSPRDTSSIRAWLVRPRPAGHELVDRWRSEQFVSLAGTHLGEVSPGDSRKAITEAVEQGYQHLDYAQRITLAGEYSQFLNVMKPGDQVVTVLDAEVYVGTITGEARNVGDTNARWQRDVAWQQDTIGAVSGLQAPLRAEIEQQGTVVDITGGMDVLRRFLDDTQPETGTGEEQPAPATVTPQLRHADSALSAELHLNQTWLQEVVDVLRDRRQLVFYGPPGTGKTYLARKLARHLTDPEAVELVQFHPSYAYEDFFEGYRPQVSDDGTAGFALTPGPLRRLAANARDDPARAYILIIDEINRANLAKVFGELYFLLEYRNDKIQLQYSPGQSFSLPANVFFIGTMNTADRSIALVDAAMRRRFAFVELHPDESPIRELLPNWLAASGKTDQRAELLAAINAAIGAEDRDFQIGPSYLMTPEAELEGGLNRIWQYSILPLLEEHYYGRLTRDQVHARFGLATIQRALIRGERSEDT
ncbi:AAA domain-containing protein [Allosaccharopolyspora coralli]|uniref:AAA domain-containing protein n=1 Tax=Allosaccharopolyspora coralli TaxID=2665642 RepID=A0A5Q3QAL2_9PSEU|nr:AAA family ATPase [Allosaccharopolyspora coralli]QGK71598.1 AAA domain-containing protein [Allosaccharopolyspora coralli]